MPKLTLGFTWNGELQFGAVFLPEFTLTAKGLRTQPKVTCRLGQTLRRENADWKDTPELYSSCAGDWRFAQELFIPKREEIDYAAFSIEFEAVCNISIKSGVTVPKTYRTTLLLKIEKDDSEQRSLVFEVGDGAVINTNNAGGNVRVRGGKNVVVNIQESPFKNAEEPEKKSPAPHFFQMELSPVKSFSGSMDGHETAENSIRNIGLKYTCDGQTYVVQLLGMEKIILGRYWDHGGARSSKCVPTDILYRFHRSDMEGYVDWKKYEKFSLTISRNLLEMQLHENALSFKKMSEHASIAFRDLNSGNLEYFTQADRPWNMLKEGLRVVLAENWYLKFSALKAQRADELESRLRDFKRLDDDRITHQLWYWGKKNETDAISIERRELHLVDPMSRKIRHLWVLTAVEIGSSAENAICVSDPAALPAHASIAFCGRQFVLVVHEAGAAYVNEGNWDSLPSGTSVELVPGTKFKIGETEFEILSQDETFEFWYKEKEKSFKPQDE